jgi:hypothetical protein
MPSSGMLRSVALVRSDVSDERIASIMRVTRIGDLGTLAVTSNRSTLTLSARGLHFVPVRCCSHAHSFYAFVVCSFFGSLFGNVRYCDTFLK